MKLRSLICGAAISLAATTLFAQQGPPDGGPPPGGPQQGGDSLAGQIFPPEMVMLHQRAIGLTADQQQALRTAVKESQGEFTDLQWQQQTEVEALHEIVKQEHPDEKAALAQLDKLLTIENKIKRTQFALALRIKNILTPEQQQKLRALRQPMRDPGGMGGPGGPNMQGRPGQDRRPD